MASDGEMLTIGPFVFRITTAAYESLQRTDNWRWATVERLGKASAEQYIGPGSRELDISGAIYTLYDAGRAIASDFVVGTRHPDNLRSLGDMGVPVQVVSGRGQVLGKWVVVSVSETQSTFLVNGSPKKQEFNIKLRAYGGEGGGGRAIVGGIAGQTFSGLFSSTNLISVANRLPNASPGQISVPDAVTSRLQAAGVL